MSITELSDKLKVSEGTIVRFCQKLGFSGFHPFKISLAITQKGINEENDFFDIAEQDMKGLKNHVAKRNTEIIESTKQFISETELALCTKLIKDAHQILISGMGASGNTAGDCFYKLLRLGLNCKRDMDAHIQAMLASQLTDKDVLIAISQSGSTLETVDIAELARKQGAKVISITGYERSPLTKFSNHILLTPTKETPFESGAISAKIAQLFVIDLLFSSLYLEMKNTGLINVQKTADSVSKWIY
jgi:DNA-binding MurR/RpiR family transcriptional regulator